MVSVGFLGAVLGDPKVSLVFLLYFSVVNSIIFVMLERIFLLRLVMFAMKSFCPSPKKKCDDDESVSGPLVRTGARGGRTILKVNTSPTLSLAD